MLAAVPRKGGREGKPDALPEHGRPEGGPGPQYIAYVLISGWYALAEEAEKNVSRSCEPAVGHPD
jgi:hypothetical protein